ncbi:hypothetical protein [Pseudoalteromonas xiamenensis]
MDKFEIQKLLKPGQKVNPVIRILAIPVAVLFLIAGAYSLHALIFEARTVSSVFASIINLLVVGFVLWPFSYVAIKGKSPKYWQQNG